MADLPLELSLMISHQPLKSHLVCICVLPTNISSLYLTVDATPAAVRLFNCWSDDVKLITWRAHRSSARLTVLGSFIKQSCLASTSVTSALDVFQKVYTIKIYL